MFNLNKKLHAFLLIILIGLSGCFYSGDTELVGAPHFRREEGSALLLKNGKVLVMGGKIVTGETFPDTMKKYPIELFDPKSKDFKEIPNVALASMFGETITLLQNGKVLIAGGHLNRKSGFRFTPIASTILFDPRTSQLTAGPNMTEPRAEHHATLLADGRVLITGGLFNLFKPGKHKKEKRSPFLLTAEIYDPQKNAFKKIGNMITARQVYQPLLLQNGNVLITGGYTKKSELFVTKLEKFIPLPDMTEERAYHSMVQLLDGRVLIVGGVPRGGGHALSSAEIYDVQANKFISISSMPMWLDSCNLLTMPDGRVLIVGGFTSDEYTVPHSSKKIEVYDPVTNSFSPLAEMHSSHDWGSPRLVLLPHHEVLILSGEGSPAEIYHYKNKDAE